MSSHESAETKYVTMATAYHAVFEKSQNTACDWLPFVIRSASHVLITFVHIHICPYLHERGYTLFKPVGYHEVTAYEAIRLE